jgi:hypothetical protein
VPVTNCDFPAVIAASDAPSHKQLSVTFRVQRLVSGKPADVLQAGNAINELSNPLEGMKLQ